MRRLALAVAALIWWLPTAALALPVTWTLTGVTFDDGGTASGSFVYDLDTNTYSGVNIITTAGTSRGGDTYPGPIYSLVQASNFLGPLTGPEAPGVSILQLVPTTLFSNVGGVRTINPVSSESTCTGPCSGTTGPSRTIVSGTFVGVAPSTVPTMTEWAMILFGMILAGGAAVMIQRRRIAG